MAQLIFLCAGDEEVGIEWNEIILLGLILLKSEFVLHFQFNGQNNMQLFKITSIITPALSVGKLLFFFAACMNNASKLSRKVMIFIKIRFCKVIAIHCSG
jgi:hypothetical protein